jgi:hypothetical protein
MYLLLSLLAAAVAWPLRGTVQPPIWDYTLMKHRAANFTADHPINRLYK